MPETLVNQIDNKNIYASRAVADEDGTNIKTSYALKSEIPTVPPLKDLVAGTNVSITETANGIEVSAGAVDQTYDGTSTNAQSGVAVASGISNAVSGKEDSFAVGDGLAMETISNVRTLHVVSNETELWASDTWSDGGDVAPGTNSSTLNEAIDNFERIRVYYRRSKLSSGSPLISQQIGEYDVSVIRSQSNSCLLAAVFLNAAGTSMYTAETMLTFNSNNLGFSETQGGQASWGSSFTSGTCFLHPYRIVGINRIASN